MRALVVCHDPLSTPERVGEHLERRGVALENFVVVDDIDNPDVSATFPNHDGHDLVVLMGAPWSAYDPRVQGWVEPEVEFVRRHLERGTPILGICFGAQIMSISLGGAVSPSMRPEYGWGSVHSDEPAIADGPWFQFHRDEFSLPERATPLAHNESGLQAFSHGHSLAVQFHPEVTPELIAAWCEAGADQKLAETGLNPEEVVKETVELAAVTQPSLEQMVDWWLEGGR